MSASTRRSTHRRLRHCCRGRRCGTVDIDWHHPDDGVPAVPGGQGLGAVGRGGEAGAGNHAWPPALSDEEITNTRHAIAQYLIEATIAQPAERQ